MSTLSSVDEVGERTVVEKKKVKAITIESVQLRITDISTLPVHELPLLLFDIAAHKDAAAMVYVYDIWKSNEPVVSTFVQRALKRVESDRGKTPPTFAVPTSTRVTLTPSRRIHKICKGAKMSKRSVDASPHIGAATQWVLEQGAGSVDARSCSGRIKTAKALAKHLAVNVETARGIVTSLKRRKVL